MQPNDSDPIKSPKKRKITLQKIIVISLLLLLTATAGTMSYLYWMQLQRSDTLQADLIQNNNKPKQNTSSPTIAPAQAKYTASVGKFTLTLPDLYYIIVDLDGGFEGGPATRLVIGTRNDTGEQTISAPAHARITVDAYPATDGNGYAERVKSSLSAYPAPGAPTATKIDGVTAESYQLDGLFSDKKIFFTKNNIVYEITAGSSDTTDGILQAVIKGFKFNG
jgi:hypothetical protein